MMSQSRKQHPMKISILVETLHVLLDLHGSIS